MAKAREPDTAPGVVVRSGIWVIAHVVGAGRRAEDVDGWLAQRPGPRRAGHDEGAGAVGDQAAVEQVQRAHLERRGEHVGDRDRVAVAGPRVQGGPLPRAAPRWRPAAPTSCRTRACGGRRPARRGPSGRRRPNGSSHSAIGLGPAMPRRGRRRLAGAVAARGRGVDAHHHVAQPGRDGGGRVLDVDLVAGAAGHGRLDERRVQAQVLGEGHGRLGVADAVDVGQGEPGVLERAEHHGDLELATRAVELAGGGHVVGHADDGGRAAQAAVLPAHVSTTPRSSPTQPRTARRSWAAAEKGVTRSLLGSFGSPSTRSPMMLRCTWSVPP